MVRPTALENSALPPASIITLSPVFWSLPQASITNASLTDRQAIVSTPLALSAPALCTNPGRCLAEQVGVKAPGRANSTTVLPLNRSSVEMVWMPSEFLYFRFVAGILSPTLMVMMLPSFLNCRVMARSGAGRQGRAVATKIVSRRAESSGLIGRCRSTARRPREGVKHCRFAQQLGQQHAVRRRRPVNDIERNAVTAEGSQVAG